MVGTHDKCARGFSVGFPTTSGIPLEDAPTSFSSAICVGPQSRITLSSALGKIVHLLMEPLRV